MRSRPLTVVYFFYVAYVLSFPSILNCAFSFSRSPSECKTLAWKANFCSFNWILIVFGSFRVTKADVFHLDGTKTNVPFSFSMFNTKKNGFIYKAHILTACQLHYMDKTIGTHDCYTSRDCNDTAHKSRDTNMEL